MWIRLFEKVFMDESIQAGSSKIFYVYLQKKKRKKEKETDFYQKERVLKKWTLQEILSKLPD